MKSETWKTLAAIFGIAAIEIAALFKGMDGKLLALSVAIISGLGGYNFAKWISKIESGLNE